MSRAQISKHYIRLLTKWPVDRLRPEIAFQNVLKARVAAPPTPEINDANTAQAEVPTGTNAARTTPAGELREINALYSLLDNRYSNEYPVSERMMNPASAPNHYKNLAKELDEVPSRSWGQSMIKRLSNMVRWQ